MPVRIITRLVFCYELKSSRVYARITRHNAPGRARKVKMINYPKNTPNALERKQGHKNGMAINKL